MSLNRGEDMQLTSRGLGFARFIALTFAVGTEAHGQPLPYEFKDAFPKTKPLLEQRPGQFPGQLPVQGPGKLDTSRGSMIGGENGFYERARIDLLEKKIELLEKRLVELEARKK
jgi:hypothetical protein